jgi:hypothetical protein
MAAVAPRQGKKGHGEFFGGALETEAVLRVLTNAKG